MGIKRCHENRIIRRLERRIGVRQPDGSIEITMLELLQAFGRRRLPRGAWQRAGYRRLMCWDIIRKGGRDEGWKAWRQKVLGMESVQKLKGA